MRTVAAFALLWLAPAAAGTLPVNASLPVALAIGSSERPSPAPQAAQSDSLNHATSQDTAAKPVSKIDPAKEALIRKLFEVQGTQKAMQEVLAGLSANMKPVLTNSLPPGDYREKLIDLFFEKFQAGMKIEELVELIIPIYDKYFSKEDLAGLIQFYQTPLGQKMSSVSSELAIEMQAAASKMGEELGRRSMLEVLAEHPEFEKAIEEAAAAPKQ